MKNYLAGWSRSIRMPGVAAWQCDCRVSGIGDTSVSTFEDAAATLCSMATLHGLAQLMLEDKAAHFLQRDDSSVRQERTAKGARTTVPGSGSQNSEHEPSDKKFDVSVTTRYL